MRDLDVDIDLDDSPPPARIAVADSPLSPPPAPDAPDTPAVPAARPAAGAYVEAGVLSEAEADASDSRVLGLAAMLTPAPARHAPPRRPYAALRLPGIDDPAPNGARMLGLCAWATTLGLIGLAVAVRAFITIVAGTAAWWFQPAVVSSGLVGIGFAAAAFMSVHRRRLPWLMLTAATTMLILTTALTTTP